MTLENRGCGQPSGSNYWGIMAKLEFERLLALGAERLAEFLMELADRDRTIENRLVTLTATNSEGLKKIRAQISGLKRIKRFYDWKSVRKLQEKIELTLQTLSQLEIDPLKGFELVCQFYETDNAVYGNCDDSSGIIADFYRNNARNLLIKFGQQCEDVSRLAEKVFELNRTNDYGVRDGVLSASCEFLPETEVRKLINRYCELADEADEENGSNEDEPWNRASRRYWDAASELAAGIKDGPLHEMAYKSTWGGKPLNAAGWNTVAKVYLSAGDPKTALQRLDNIDADQSFQQYETEDLRIAAHQAIGEKANIKAIVSILRKRLFAAPSSAILAKLDEYLEASERKPILNELFSHYVENQELDLSFLAFVLNEFEVEIAESYLLERSDQIDGERYYTLAPLAKLFIEKNCPLAATVILRALADSILQRGASKYYKIAVGYINLAGKLAPGISDWQNHIDHSAHLQYLSTTHARKSAFWSKMG